jgi:hypothetical protein
MKRLSPLMQVISREFRGMKFDSHWWRLSYNSVWKLSVFFLAYLTTLFCWDYGTSRKVVGSIPHAITELFNWSNPSSRIMVLGSSQFLT